MDPQLQPAGFARPKIAGRRRQHTEGERNLRAMEMIGRIYGAALDDVLWSGLAEDMARLFDAPSAVLHIRQPGGNTRLLYSTENLHPSSASLQEQAAYWRRHDLWVHRARELGSGRVLMGEELFPLSWLLNTGFYQDWCRHLDICHIAGAMLALPSGDFATIAIHRPHGSKCFAEEQRGCLALLLPHFSKALEILCRLKANALERAASAQAVRHSNTAVIVVTPSRRVLYVNGMAESLLRQGDGVHLSGGYLTTATSRDSEALARQVAAKAFLAEVEVNSPRVGVPTVPAALRIHRQDRLPLTILVAPMRDATLPFFGPAAMVLLHDPERQTPQVATLRELFGLTGAEAVLASELAKGRALENIADQLDISLNTARTHLKSILAKTNTGRQAELVALILRSTAVFNR